MTWSPRGKEALESLYKIIDTLRAKDLKEIAVALTTLASFIGAYEHLVNAAQAQGVKVNQESLTGSTEAFGV